MSASDADRVTATIRGDNCSIELLIGSDPTRILGAIELQSTSGAG
jgi:hypothetical protein